jgi:hypothetical protein
MAGKRKGTDVVNQTPADKFCRLAEQRTGQALKYIGLVGNLAGPGYASTPALRNQIIEALQAAVDRAKERFEGKPQAAAGFRLAKDGD